MQEKAADADKEMIEWSGERMPKEKVEQEISEHCCSYYQFEIYILNLFLIWNRIKTAGD